MVVLDVCADSALLNFTYMVVGPTVQPAQAAVQGTNS